MKKLTIGDLEKLRKQVQEDHIVREGKALATINLHMGTCGIAAGARKVMTGLLQEIEKKGIKNVRVSTSGCAGLCSREPMATVQVAGQPPVKYVDLTDEKIRRILSEHVLGGNIVKEYVLAVGSERVG
jgi:NADP-reducing hydrogenase subunit HndB